MAIVDYLIPLLICCLLAACSSSEKEKKTDPCTQNTKLVGDTTFTSNSDGDEHLRDSHLQASHAGKTKAEYKPLNKNRLSDIFFHWIVLPVL